VLLTGLNPSSGVVGSDTVSSDPVNLTLNVTKDEGEKTEPAPVAVVETQVGVEDDTKVDDQPLPLWSESLVSGEDWPEFEDDVQSGSGHDTNREKRDQGMPGSDHKPGMMPPRGMPGSNMEPPKGFLVKSEKSSDTPSKLQGRVLDLDTYGPNQRGYQQQYSQPPMNYGNRRRSSEEKYMRPYTGAAPYNNQAPPYGQPTTYEGGQPPYTGYQQYSQPPNNYGSKRRSSEERYRRPYGGAQPYAGQAPPYGQQAAYEARQQHYAGQQSYEGGQAAYGGQQSYTAGGQQPYRASGQESYNGGYNGQQPYANAQSSYGGYNGQQPYPSGQPPYGGNQPYGGQQEQYAGMQPYGSQEYRGPYGVRGRKSSEENKRTPYAYPVGPQAYGSNEAYNGPQQQVYGAPPSYGGSYGAAQPYPPGPQPYAGGTQAYPGGSQPYGSYSGGYQQPYMGGQGYGGYGTNAQQVSGYGPYAPAAAYGMNGPMNNMGYGGAGYQLQPYGGYQRPYPVYERSTTSTTEPPTSTGNGPTTAEPPETTSSGDETTPQPDGSTTTPAGLLLFEGDIMSFHQRGSLCIPRRPWCWPPKSGCMCPRSQSSDIETESLFDVESDAFEEFEDELSAADLDEESDVLNEADELEDEQGDVAEEVSEQSGGICRCGRMRRGRPCGQIINGREACPMGKYSFASRILHRIRGFVCAGSLINSEWVVTAARCILTTQASQFTVTVGDHDITKMSETPDIHVSRASQVWVHPKFDRRTLANDIALVRLSTPVQFHRSTIRPVCLPKSPIGPKPDSMVTVIGWGSPLGVGARPGSAFLREAKTRVISTSRCRTVGGPYSTLMPGNLCLFKSSSQRMCEGDEGGPMLLGDGTAVRPWSLGGVISWIQTRTKKSSCPNLPTVVTNFPNYMRVIKKVARTGRFCRR